MKKQTIFSLVLIVVFLLCMMIASDFMKLKQFFIFGVETFKEKMDTVDTNDTNEQISIKAKIPLYDKKDEEPKQHPGYCFIGDTDGTRHCVELEQNDKCVSGQIYKSKEICVNPDLRN